MLDQVRRTIQEYRLLVPGDKVIVGVSGGPDSLALLHSLMILQGEFDYTLQVAHLNHGLRLEAADDAAYVRDLANCWGLPVIIAQRDVLAYQKEHRLSLEAAAREVRYRFLREAAAAAGATRIAVGHQAEDQAETVLLNLLRGSGLKGLKGMLPRRGDLIRPLLFIDRATIEAYCREQGLQPRRDFTNDDVTYRRNKIRHQLLPLLAREYNPAIVATLGRTAMILQEDERVLADLADRALTDLIKSRDEDGLILYRQGWLDLDPALQRRVLKLAAAALGRQVSFHQVEQAREIARHGGALTWPGRWRLLAKGPELHLELPRGEPERLAFAYPLAVPGLTPLPELGQAIRAEFAPPPRTFAPGRQDEAWLDREQLKEPLLVRNWRQGDFFHPLGLKGKKKLHDYFIDRHLPAARRPRVPLVTSGGRIAWVAGLGLADDFKVTPATRETLHLQLEPWPQDA
ncbi:tRNA lysidine(34) synthetase TilS [Moorella naiadis]|uniref:tRNA lysidine(34) synthetase TilS n=1 Tax=Moorella naiadis (nom. illeg.) TaxID=3093670 RepID=UPI003D9C8490